MTLESSEHDVSRALDILTHRSSGHVLALAATAMLAFGCVDPFFVPEGKRAYWLMGRALTSACLFGLFVANRRSKPGTHSKFFAYAGVLLCTGVLIFLNFQFGEVPSPHYAAMIMIMAVLCMVTWEARHTLIVGAVVVVSWLGVNFVGAEHFDSAVFGFHAAYLVTALMISVSISFMRQRLNMQTLEQRRALSEAVAQREILARQTAHDIRSPVSAMLVVCNSPGLREDERLLLRDAIGRVNDIANNLVSHHGGTTKNTDKAMRQTHLSPLLHSLMSEKRSSFRASGISFVLEEAQDAASAFAELNPIAFSRSVSNLLNNAAESMSTTGAVRAVLQANSDEVLLEIRDEGCGISRSNIEKVLRGGVSIGKVQGSGLGLSSSAAAVRQWGGELAIASEVGRGTTVSITMPRSVPAAWFATEVALPSRGKVFVVDDDASMGRLWANRLRGTSLALTLDVQVFTLVSEFVKAVRDCSVAFTCLVDIELIGSPRSGLDAVEEADCWTQTNFVTSHYDDENLQSACLRNGAKIVPKAFAAKVPIVIIEEDSRWEVMSRPSDAPS